MTDARYPERWLNDRRLLLLTDAAHRLFVVALAWSVSNRTDGVITDDDLLLLTRVDPGRAAELEHAQLWERDGNTWIVVDYAETQTSRDQLVILDNLRRRDRDNKAKQRAKKAGVPEALSHGTSGGTVESVPRDKQGDSIGKARARARTGLEKESNHTQNGTTPHDPDDAASPAVDAFFSGEKPDNWPAGVPYPPDGGGRARARTDRGYDD